MEVVHQGIMMTISIHEKMLWYHSQQWMLNFNVIFAFLFLTSTGSTLKDLLGQQGK